LSRENPKGFREKAGPSTAVLRTFAQDDKQKDAVAKLTMASPLKLLQIRQSLRQFWEQFFFRLEFA
jgi:hypothetical protein